MIIYDGMDRISNFRGRMQKGKGPYRWTMPCQMLKDESDQESRLSMRPLEASFSAEHALLRVWMTSRPSRGARAAQNFIG